MLEPAAALRVEAGEVVRRAGATGLPTGRPQHGAAGGLHVGRRRGGGIEFAEHRDYAAGDDLRHLDWRAYARRDRLLVKRFEAEVHTDVWLVFDGSASMALVEPAVAGGDPVDKLHRFRVLALAIGLATVAGGDAVGLDVPAADGPSTSFPPRGGSAATRTLGDALLGVRGAGAPGLPSWRPRGRGAVLALTDGLAPADAVVAPLAAARRAGAEVTLVHGLHPREIAFDFESVVTLRCEETGDERIFDPRRMQDEAAMMMQAHCRALRFAAESAGVRYVFADLGGDLAAPLRELLASAGQGRRSA